MKITYKGQGNLNSRGTIFTPDVSEYEVSVEDAEYLVATFKEYFVAIKSEPKKVEAKPEVEKVGTDKKAK